jgi:hypothetical protein
MSADPTDPAVWVALAGRDVPVRSADGGSTTWACTGCSEPAESGGWLSWQVTFRAPGAVGQGTFLFALPGATPDDEPAAVFVVPERGSADSTDLVATFAVAAPTTEGGRR